MKFTRIMMCALLAMAGFGTNAIAEDTGYVLRVVKYGMVAEDDTAVPPGGGDEGGDDGSSGEGPGEEPGGAGPEDDQTGFAYREWEGSTAQFTYELEESGAPTMMTAGYFLVAFDPNHERDDFFLYVDAVPFITGEDPSWYGLPALQQRAPSCSATGPVSMSSFYQGPGRCAMISPRAPFDPELHAGVYTVTLKYALDPDYTEFMNASLSFELTPNGNLVIRDISSTCAPVDSVECSSLNGDDGLEVTGGEGYARVYAEPAHWGWDAVIDAEIYVTPDAPAFTVFSTVAPWCYEPDICAAEAISTSSVSLWKGGVKLASHSAPATWPAGVDEETEWEHVFDVPVAFDPDVHAGSYRLSYEMFKVDIYFVVDPNGAVSVVRALYDGEETSF